ncbi:ras protein [Mycena sanguinolenta]|nr:ras protein [Mycena sanguinolenta]
MQAIDTWQILVLGEAGVGKSSLSIRFALDHFPGCYDPTIEDTLTKQTVVDVKICVVKLQDTAWQEDWGAGFIYRDWAEKSDACMLVFSITCRGLFGSTARFHEQLKALNEGLLIGTISDLADNREVSKEEGAVLAKQFGCQYIEMSAKTGQKVERAVASLVRALRQINKVESPVVPKKFNKMCRCVIL